MNSNFGDMFAGGRGHNQDNMADNNNLINHLRQMQVSGLSSGASDMICISCLHVKRGTLLFQSNIGYPGNMLGQNVSTNQMYNSMGILQRGYTPHDPGIIPQQLQNYPSMGQHPSLQQLQPQTAIGQQNPISAHSKPRASAIVPHKAQSSYYHKQSQSQSQTSYPQQMVATSSSSHMAVSSGELARPSSNANQHVITQSSNQPHAMDYSSAQHALSQQTSQSQVRDLSPAMFGMISEPGMTGVPQHLPPGRYVPQKSINQNQPQPAHSKALQQKSRDMQSQMSLDHHPPPPMSSVGAINSSQMDIDQGKSALMSEPVASNRQAPRPAVSHVPFKMDSMRKNKEQQQMQLQQQQLRQQQQQQLQQQLQQQQLQQQQLQQQQLQHQNDTSHQQPLPVTSRSAAAGSTAASSRKGPTGTNSQPTSKANKKPPASHIVPFKMDAMRKSAQQKSQHEKNPPSANDVPRFSPPQSKQAGTVNESVNHSGL